MVKEKVMTQDGGQHMSKESPNGGYFIGVMVAKIVVPRPCQPECNMGKGKVDADRNNHLQYE